ncbi:hypothetical protein SAMN04487988_103219 [Algoriphagus hitonicola]|uniref:Uncharacterized protein n=1 Tax=Algoriphagus hitonicola TaxID=435880 RepID=A0A1I2REL1_9BACT|nr:hypothetical protein SAMN04487988_103219 [Algoriphagus hitonicola]
MPKFYKCNADRTFIVEKINAPWACNSSKIEDKQIGLLPVKALNRLQDH